MAGLKRIPAFIVFNVFLVILLVFVICCKEKDSVREIVIVHSADVNGEFEPCG